MCQKIFGDGGDRHMNIEQKKRLLLITITKKKSTKACERERGDFICQK